RGDDNAGIRFGAIALRRRRRSIRDGGDRHLDVRLPESLRARGDARLLRDGRRRRVLSAGRPSPSQIPDAVARDRVAIDLGDRADADRHLWDAARLRGVRRLDLFRAHRRVRLRVSPHDARRAASVPDLGLSIHPRAVRDRADRNRLQRHSRQPGAVGDGRGPDDRGRARVLLLEDPSAGSRLRAPVMNLPAPYMRWAKTRPRVTYDLASSGLMPVTTRELLGEVTAADAFEISGPTDEGLLPLREAIAARY